MDGFQLQRTSGWWAQGLQMLAGEIGALSWHEQMRLSDLDSPSKKRYLLPASAKWNCCVLHLCWAIAGLHVLGSSGGTH
jgi:hypothetical protein